MQETSGKLEGLTETIKKYVDNAAAADFKYFAAKMASDIEETVVARIEVNGEYLTYAPEETGLDIGVIYVGGELIYTGNIVSVIIVIDEVFCFLPTFFAATDGYVTAFLDPTAFSFYGLEGSGQCKIIAYYQK